MENLYLQSSLWPSRCFFGTMKHMLLRKCVRCGKLVDHHSLIFLKNWQLTLYVLSIHGIFAQLGFEYRSSAKANAKLALAYLENCGKFLSFSGKHMNYCSPFCRSTREWKTICWLHAMTTTPVMHAPLNLSLFCISTALNFEHIDF